MGSSHPLLSKLCVLLQTTISNTNGLSLSKQWIDKILIYQQFADKIIPSPCFKIHYYIRDIFFKLKKSVLKKYLLIQKVVVIFRIKVCCRKEIYHPSDFAKKLVWLYTNIKLNLFIALHPSHILNKTYML